ncbi:TRAP transporter substrate-binding protein [Halomonas cerina]|uniref:TRAP-type C4-dicarboxylate transport system substrate-binding protein n=1 Tax=Halomonas cerina TaxID=447424 RepID=A0A839VD20_9GAMM|nr:TRAP transporter substrate-binding protein [Halomonas cerina]MBB3191925.1 TRAP-type C4-dicarboxylate transport system substrate-binding protein [Halomonas cerina]
MKSYKLLIGALCLGSWSSAAMAQDVTLRFAHWLPAQQALPSTGFKEWTESIHEASRGSIRFQMFPAQQLGSAENHYDMAANGIADITWTNPGYTAGRFPVSDLLQLPFVIGDTLNGSAAATEWYQQYADQEMSEVVMCMIHGHYPGTLHSKEEIRHPDQISGMSIRPATSTIAQFVSELGGASVQVSAPEAREALARGTADAIFFPSGALNLFGIDKTTRYHIDYPVYSSWQAILINRNTYERLNDQQQAVIDDHCNGEWATRVSRGWEEEELAGLEKLRTSPEHTMIELTDEELAAWREAAMPLLENWAERVRDAGYEPESLVTDLRERLAAVDAMVEGALIE